MDKATPLRSNGPTPASAIQDDIEALSSGRPDLRDLQKIALFSSSHPISVGESSEDVDGEDGSIWEENRVFDRIFDGLTDFLQPDQVGYLQSALQSIS
jgi:CLIP-associating protein 1/2